VKQQSGTRWLVLAMVSFSLVAWAGDKKNKPASSPVVDSGSFGVYIKGQRVITESFRIEQQNGISTVKAQLKEAASSGTVQKCELEMTSAGELIRYDWSEDSGASLTASVDNEFLVEKIATPGATKPAEHTLYWPGKTSILDNNFFVHREVLVWRYLAGACNAEGGNWKCQQGSEAFGVFVPQDHTWTSVRMELVGKEKVTIRGAERELLRVNLTGESFEWALWVDAQDQFKLMRVTIPADKIEVVRD
jgi:hypothetical protein